MPQKRKVDGKPTFIPSAKTNATGPSRVRKLVADDRSAKAAVKSVQKQTAPKPTIGSLRDRITDLEVRLSRAEEMRDAAQDRASHYYGQGRETEEALKTVSRLLTNAQDENRRLEEALRRRPSRDLDDEIPF